ncbi:MAG: peptide chain release factor N(5)-glutamine methyltransferase [Deltaproteobacteria bacterium]
MSKEKKFSTVGEALSWAVERLSRRSIPDPVNETEYLLTHILDFKRHELFLNSRRALSPEESRRFEAFIERRMKREPAQYITGEVEFLGLKLKVTPATLIPRPETELVVKEAVKAASAFMRDKKKALIIDLCTGSGCIAVAIAKEFPQALVRAADISGTALKVAEENALKNGVGERVNFLKGDLFAPFKESGLDVKADIILSNPPYVAKADFERLAPEVKDHEPTGALYAGADGLDFYRRIIKESPDYLSPGGFLVMELGWGQSESVKGLAAENGSYEDIEIKKDYSGVERIFLARRKMTA